MEFYTHIFIYLWPKKEGSRQMIVSCNANLHTTRTSVWMGRRVQNTLSFSLSQLYVCTYTPKTLHRFLNFTCKAHEGAAPLGSQDKAWGMLSPRALRQWGTYNWCCMHQFKTVWSDTKPASVGAYDDAHDHHCCSWPPHHQRVVPDKSNCGKPLLYSTKTVG